MFHVFNSFTFKIGIFPFLSIALNLFFLDPEKVRRFFFKTNPRLFKGIIAYIQQAGIQAISNLWFRIYLFIQVILPMRPWFFPGNVFWTEEGSRMSWKMMLRTKTGSVHFKVIDPASGKNWNIDPSRIFTPFHVMWLAISPDIIWQYAQRIKNEFAKKGFPHVEVYALGSVSLNRSTLQTPGKPCCKPCRYKMACI